MICFRVFLALFLVLSVGYSAIGEKEPFVYSEKNRRDPFSAFTKVSLSDDSELSGKLIELRSLEVEGIVWDEKNPLAMIGDDIISVGSVVLGAKVVEIKKTEVILKYKGETVTIEVKVDDNPFGFPE